MKVIPTQTATKLLFSHLHFPKCIFIQTNSLIIVSNVNFKSKTRLFSCSRDCTRFDICLFIQFDYEHTSLEQTWYVFINLSISRLSYEGVDVVEWSRALDVRLSEWCCSVSMVWVQIPSREEQIFDSSKI